MGAGPYYWAVSWSVPGESSSHLISPVTHLELGSSLSSFLSVTPSNHSSTVLWFWSQSSPALVSPSPRQHPQDALSASSSPPPAVSAPSPSNPMSGLQAESVFWPVTVPLDLSVAPTVLQVKVRLNKQPIRSCSFKFPPALAHLCCGAHLPLRPRWIPESPRCRGPCPPPGLAGEPAWPWARRQAQRIWKSFTPVPAVVKDPSEVPGNNRPPDDASSHLLPASFSPHHRCSGSLWALNLSSLPSALLPPLLPEPASPPQPFFLSPHFCVSFFYPVLHNKIRGLPGKVPLSLECTGEADTMGARRGLPSKEEGSSHKSTHTNPPASTTLRSLPELKTLHCSSQLRLALPRVTHSQGWSPSLTLLRWPTDCPVSPS